MHRKLTKYLYQFLVHSTAYDMLHMDKITEFKACIMAINMNQYIKGLGGESEDAGMPFSVSHFESALNNANDQLMQQYISTEAYFS